MNRIPARARGALAALAATLLAGPVLAGCGVAQQAGAAAVVDGDRITVSRLQDLTRELERVEGDLDPQTRQPLPAGEAQRRTLEKLIASRVLARAAAESGVQVRQGDVDERYAQFVEIAGGDAAVRTGLATARNVPPSYARQYVRDLVTSERLAADLVPGSAEDPQVQGERQQALNDLLVRVGGEMEVTVNPRYGSWRPDSGAIEPLVSGGLARALDAAGAEGPAGPGVDPGTEGDAGSGDGGEGEQP